MGGRRQLAPGGVEEMLYGIDEKDAALMRIPQFMPFEPDVPIGSLASAFVDQTISFQDFVCTKVGFTSGTVGFPAAAGRWKVQIEDIGASRNFQPNAWNVTGLIGTNSGFADAAAVELPSPWVFLRKTTIRVTYENIDGFGGTPELLLVGYLTNWQRDVVAAQERQKLELQIAQSALARNQAGWQNL